MEPPWKRPAFAREPVGRMRYNATAIEYAKAMTKTASRIPAEAEKGPTG
jgi:hypothetical protein